MYNILGTRGTKINKTLLVLPGAHIPGKKEEEENTASEMKSHRSFKGICGSPTRVQEVFKTVGECLT